MTLRVGVLL